MIDEFSHDGAAVLPSEEDIDALSRQERGELLARVRLAHSEHALVGDPPSPHWREHRAAARWYGLLQLRIDAANSRAKAVRTRDRDNEYEREQKRLWHFREAARTLLTAEEFARIEDAATRGSRR